MEENFLVVVFDWDLYQNITIIVKSRAELCRIIGSLTEGQTIVQITPINNLYETEEYLKYLRENDKEDGLNFGKTE